MWFSWDHALLWIAHKSSVSCCTVLKSLCVSWVIECFACILVSTCGSVATDQKKKKKISSKVITN